MSVQRECAIVEEQPGKWYLLLAMHEYGRLDDSDANCYGSFKTEEEADEYRMDNFSNPGGVSVYKYDGQPLPQRFVNLIKRAYKVEKDRYGWFGG